MADELDKETQRLTNFAKKYKESMSETGDLATQMLQTFKDINGILDKNTKNIDKSRSFQKEILSDAKARGMIENQINSEIEDAEKQILKLKMAKYDSDLNSKFVGEKTIELQKEVIGLQERENTLVETHKVMTENLLNIQEKILKVENEKQKINATIMERQQALTKVILTQKANEDAMSANANKQESIKSKLLAVEKEISEAQSGGLGYSHEYEVLLKKHEYFKNKITGLEKIGNGYIKDKIRLEERREKIEDDVGRLMDEELGIEESLIALKREEKDISSEMKKVWDNVLDLQSQRLNLEGEINNMRKHGLSDEEIDVMIEKLNIQIKQNQEAAKLAKQQAGFLAYMKDTAASSGGLLGNIAGMASKAKNVANSFKTIPGPFIILKALLEFSLDRFEKLDKAAEDFRKQTGFSNTQMVELRKNAESVNIELQEFGVGIKEAYDAAKALTDVFGHTSLVTKEAMTNVALMNANLNVAVEDSAKVLATFQGLGGATQEAAMNMMKIGAGLSEKAGVPFSLVMKDIADASETTTAMLGANPSKLMKSAIAARALGTDMNKIVASQRKLLDYSSSMNDELELSALLGKSVSFQLSRQLAFEGDIAGAAKATLETVKAAGDFDKMSVYQREKLAQASGMELKDLTKMMAVDKQREEIMLGGDQAAKDKLKLQDETLKKLEEENDLSKQGLLADGERAIQQQKMQGLMTKMKNLLESITVIAGDILEPLITPMVGILIPLLKVVAGAVKLILYPFKALAETIKWAAMGTSKWAMSFQPVKDVVETIGNGFSWLSKQVSELFSETKEGGMSWAKGIGAGVGVLALLFFGKGGFGKIMDMVKAPFDMVKDIGKNMLGKLTGKGAASDFIRPKLPDASAAGDGVGKAAKATKDVKSGTGVKDFLTNLASGLKEMGSVKVLFGAFNLIPASIGLIAMIPGTAGAFLMSKIDGKSLKSSMTGLADGLEKMGTGKVSGGAGNLILAAAGLIAMIPGTAGAALVALINGDSLKSSMTGLADGLEKMGTGSVAKGSLVMILAGVGFAAMTVGAIGLGAVALFGVAAGVGLTGLAVGLAALGNPVVGLGVLILLGVSLAFVGIAYAIKLASEAFINIAKILPEIIVPLMQFAIVSPLLYIAAGSIGALALSFGMLAAMTMPALVAAAAVYIIAKSVDKLGDSFEKTAKGISLFSKTSLSIINPIKQLATANLKEAATGISSLGSALSDFGTGSAVAGIGSFIGNFLGGDPIAKMEKLASIGDKLKITADSISAIAQATSQFRAIDVFAESVGRLAESLGKLNDQLGKIKSEELSKLSQISSASGTTSTSEESKSMKVDNSGIEAKLDKLTDLLVGGAIRVYMDGADVSSAISSRSN